MSFASSSSREYETPSRRLSFQEAKQYEILQKMFCWLVDEGTNAMELSLRNDSPLKPRTDLGDQGVRVDEVRQMTAAAYASGKATRIKYWYSKLYSMKKKMREEIDKHLAQCSKHTKYQRLRNKIDALRKSIATEKFANLSSSKNVDPPPKRHDNIETDTSDSNSDGNTSESDSDQRSTTKKRKRVEDPIIKVSRSKERSLSKTRRKNVAIEKVKLSQSEVNVPLQIKAGSEASNDEIGSIENSPINNNNWIRVVKIEALQSDESPAGKKRRIAGEN